MSPGLMGDDTEGLASETYFSNAIVSLKQYLIGLKTKTEYYGKYSAAGS